MQRDVTISEVGPRDGLQMVSQVMPTEVKCRWIAALHAAGLPEIEVASFVPPALVPQMADAEAVTRFAKTLPGLHVAVLVPNKRGAEAAVAAGADKITLTLSASEKHSQANLRRSRERQMEEARALAAHVMALATATRPSLEAGLSTAFGCSLQGEVPEREVVEMAVALAEAGFDSVGLSDTAGYAQPAQVRRLLRAVRAEIGERCDSLHMHDTMGLGLANVTVGVEEGIRIFDGALAGLGGCPFAPGASGNIVTEDLVFLLESLGLRTGVDLDALLAARAILAEALPREPLHGAYARAGRPTGWRAAA
ncbi:hydroxymethylglutaryl-CoA lyase [Roseococcus suduntuyensis]|uniref:Hydroxymethylglutaryl-CoA lyase n=1 Tax=Roseococcus suduntuyensis TaxID=455361 RepID=A0A840A7X8_9PROT|nr:hydroxymethylglutaryl-CoA lyase [Roseococcus suduntuyensis]MBB3896593.1 hydroxymethylglutaryl-CoA lyase [Roseococcus suduntuyensis]